MMISVDLSVTLASTWTVFFRVVLVAVLDGVDQEALFQSRDESRGDWIRYNGNA